MTNPYLAVVLVKLRDARDDYACSHLQGYSDGWPLQCALDAFDAAWEAWSVLNSDCIRWCPDLAAAGLWRPAMETAKAVLDACAQRVAELERKEK